MTLQFTFIITQSSLIYLYTKKTTTKNFSTGDLQTIKKKTSQDKIKKNCKQIITKKRRSPLRTQSNQNKKDNTNIHAKKSKLATLNQTKSAYPKTKLKKSNKMAVKKSNNHNFRKTNRKHIAQEKGKHTI